jgi:hypothetical protein
MKMNIFGKTYVYKGWGYDGADDKTVCLLCHTKYLESKEERGKVEEKRNFSKN